MSKVVAIVGGGIAGLSAANHLVDQKKQHELPLAIVLVEANDRLGGLIKSERLDGYVVEHGPDSFINAQPWALNLCINLGLADKIIGTNEKNRRALVAHRERLYPLPPGFIMVAPTRLLSFLASPLFSLPAKLRVMAEFLLPRRPASLEDETVGDFIRRRFGNELYERAAKPLIGGIYTADADQLSANATMPRFVELERKYGSIIRGLCIEQKQSSNSLKCDTGARYSLFSSLVGGMQQLVEALVDKLRGEHIELKAKVASLRPGKEKRWCLQREDGSMLEADAVILAVPSGTAGNILGELDEPLSQHLRSMETASSVVVNMLFAEKHAPDALDAFGFVVPSHQGGSLLAGSFISTKLINRAPTKGIMIRLFLGGQLYPNIIGLTDEELKTMALEALKLYMSITSSPEKIWLSRFSHSMPIYKINHLDAVKEINNLLAVHAGLALAGASYGGVGIPDCIHSGELAGESVFSFLFSPDTQALRANR